MAESPWVRRGWLPSAILTPAAPKPSEFREGAGREIPGAGRPARPAILHKRSIRPTNYGAGNTPNAGRRQFGGTMQLMSADETVGQGRLDQIPTEWSLLRLA